VTGIEDAPRNTMTEHNHRMPSLVSGALRTFAFWVANGSVGQPLLDGVDYREAILEEPSLMEAAFAIFANTVEWDDDGVPQNAKQAEHRAAQYIRQYCDPAYMAEPPFETWEVELHPPPPVRDPSTPNAKEER